MHEANYELLIRFADYYDVSIDYILCRTANLKINKQPLKLLENFSGYLFSNYFSVSRFIPARRDRHSHTQPGRAGIFRLKSFSVRSIIV